jgi:hypothetical protein
MLLRPITRDFLVLRNSSYVFSVFSELNSPIGAYVVSNLAQSDILSFHLSFNKAHNLKVLSVALLSRFFVQFGSFIKIQLNLDLFVQPALVLCLMFLWLCSFFKAMFPIVNDLWVSKLKKTDVPCDSN